MIIIFIAVTLLNAVYFTDIYNDGSENLSSKQSQQLMILNTVTCFLLFIGLFCIIYICMNESDKFNQIIRLESIFKKKTQEFDNKIDDIQLLNYEHEKKNKTKEEITQIIEEIEESKLATKIENNTLQKEKERLETEITDLKENYDDLNHNHKNLLKINEQLEDELFQRKEIIDEMDKNFNLKEKLNESREGTGSILTEGPQYEDDLKLLRETQEKTLSENKRTLFDTSHKIEGITIPSLFSENISLGDNEEDVKQQEKIFKRNLYESFIRNKKNSIQKQPNRSGYFGYQKSDSKNITNTSTESGYKPYNQSFLKQIFKTF